MIESQSTQRIEQPNENAEMHLWITRARTLMLVGATMAPAYFGAERMAEKPKSGGQKQPKTKADFTKNTPKEAALKARCAKKGWMPDNITKTCVRPNSRMWKNFLSKPEIIEDWGPMSTPQILTKTGTRKPMLDRHGRPVRLRKIFADALQRADDKLFQEKGVHIVINSHFRSAEDQAKLYQRLVVERIAKGLDPGPVGSSGYANHGGGIAIDVQNWRIAQDYLAEQGFAGGMYTDGNMIKRRPHKYSKSKCAAKKGKYNEKKGVCFTYDKIKFRNGDPVHFTPGNSPVWNFYPKTTELYFNPQFDATGRRAIIKARLAEYDIYRGKFPFKDDFEEVADIFGGVAKKAGNKLGKELKRGQRILDDLLGKGKKKKRRKKSRRK